MNIAVIKRKYQEEGGGGAENYARFIVNGLIEKGHKVFILAKDFKAEESKNLKHLPVKINKLASSSGTTAFHKGVQKILKLYIKKYNIDVTYALSRTYPIDVFRVTEQVHIEWMNLNYSSIQKLNPRHRGILGLEKNIFSTKNTKAVITNSELSKQLLIKHYNYPENNIHVFRNGISDVFFEISEKKNMKSHMKIQLLGEKYKNKFILLFVATNFHIKGLSSAIKAISKLPDNIRGNTILLILGGDKPENYIKLAKELNVADNILFMGSCNKMKFYYLISDILVYPSLGEPFGNVCLEAAASGLPVITTKQNGSSEIISEGNNGYLIENAGHIDTIAKSIENYFNLPANRKEDFSKNSVNAAKEYNWEKHLDNLEKLLITINRK